MQITKRTNSSFVIEDDAKVISFVLFGIVLLTAFAFFVTVPEMSGMGFVALFFTVVYFFTGHISRAYRFDKHDKEFSLEETAFFKTTKKHFDLDDIKSIVFVPISQPGIIVGVPSAIGELAGPEGMVVILKTGEKVEIKPSMSNYTKYVFHNDISHINETEEKAGKDLADFLHVPFEIKQGYELHKSKGPSQRFIQFLLKIVYALLLFLAVFIVIALLAGILNRLFSS